MKLRIERKAYTRKPYIRKDGTRVKASKVGASSFSIRDRGKKGRTPKSERWYHPTVQTGWSKSDSAETRRMKALKAHGGDELATARGLQALSSVTTDPTTKRLARADALYFYRRHAEE